MKPIYYALLAASLVITEESFADILLKGGNGVHILAINGIEKDIDSHLLRDSGITLNNGENQLLVTYTTEIETANSEYELEHTDPFIILFTAQNKNLSLSAPKLETEKDFNEFKRNGAWVLRDAHNAPVKYEMSILRKEGFQLSRNYETELAHFNRSGGPAALAMPSTTTTTHSSMPSTKDMPSTPESMLHYWYNQADEATRARFRVWVNSK